MASGHFLKSTVYYPCPSDAALKYTVTALRVRFGSYAVRELSEVPLSCSG